MKKNAAPLERAQILSLLLPSYAKIVSDYKSAFKAKTEKANKFEEEKATKESESKTAQQIAREVEIKRTNKVREVGVKVQERAPKWATVRRTGRANKM